MITLNHASDVHVFVGVPCDYIEIKAHINKLHDTDFLPYTCNESKRTSAGRENDFRDDRTQIVGYMFDKDVKSLCNVS